VNDSARHSALVTTAVLLVNTGTPSSPTTGAVRRFLRRFLSDPRVIELPRALWLPLLYAVVLPLRSPRSAHKYQQIWQQEGSPLLIYTSKIRQAVQRELHALRGPIHVEQAFLYSPPDVATTLGALREAGIRRLIVLPLFPQSSGSTTGAVYDQVAQALRHWRALPLLRYIGDYHAEPDYISALATSVRDHWRLHGRSKHLLMSFHGIPVSYVTGGDRYADECRQTAALLASALSLEPREWTLTFQSRFGANRWLTPATDRTLMQLPRRGVRAVTVMCPGFAADCLETLEEIALTGRDLFMKAGGEHYEYVPALNARSDHASALAGLIQRSIADWPPPPGLNVFVST
jgi:protoporphyrin/coproporphyrin ferrochelatase